MGFQIILIAYRLVLPLLFIAAFPGWVVKMLKRGGFGTRLGERISIYTIPNDYEPCGAVHVHSVSVGETMLALKLIREWRIREPERRFVIATGTATGHAMATAATLTAVRVTYAPLDFRWMVRRYLNRFEPQQIVLIEGEVWPIFMRECQAREIPVSLVNARMSPRSRNRFMRFAKFLSPIYGLLDAVTLQQKDDASVWKMLGVAPEKIHATGSLKYDPNSGPQPTQRSEFSEIINACGKERPVILAASTFAGEEVFIAEAIRAAEPQALAMIVPRHAERGAEVKSSLEKAGFAVQLRSQHLTEARSDVLLIDSTGELRDWTAHADAVVIGKSFFSMGGQNPCEAIQARKPLILGPHMENFQALVSQLIAADACISVKDRAQLIAAIRIALHPHEAQLRATAATVVLAEHEGATQRILEILTHRM